jgi:hypothetical protein
MNGKINHFTKIKNMKCESLLKLSDYDQAVYMANLIHTCISDEANFKSGLELVRLGKLKGLFDDVKIGHREVYKDTQTPIGEDIRKPEPPIKDIP